MTGCTPPNRNAAQLPPLRTGIEVHRVKGIGWGVFTRFGETLDRQWICATANEADVWATEYREDAAPGIIERCGVEPYLKLSGEVGDAAP